MPPHISQSGNDYVPPDSQLMESGQLETLTMGIQLTEFKHDHHGARQRLLHMRKIELTHA
jgi:hypothetical protein